MKLINAAVGKGDSSDFASCPFLHSQLSCPLLHVFLSSASVFSSKPLFFSEARSDNQDAETENDSRSLSGGFTPALLIQNRLSTEGE